jgi:hypothetical protein
MLSIGCASRTSSVLMLCAMSLPFAVQVQVITQQKEALVLEKQKATSHLRMRWLTCFVYL